jgi:hypothetical protein
MVNSLKIMSRTLKKIKEDFSSQIPFSQSKKLLNFSHVPEAI